MDHIEKIKELIQPIVQSLNIKLYDAKWVQQKRDKILQIAVMKKDGTMDIETCSTISEMISEALDAADFISYEYFLEVCSPGAEREIIDYSEFSELIGAHVYVRVIHPIKKMQEFTGEVLSAQDNEIEMTYRDKALTKKVQIEKNNIDYCRLAVKM